VGCLTRRFPCEGVRIEAVSKTPSPEPQVPLVKLVALQSIIECRSSRRIRLPAPTMNSLFPTARCGFPIDTVPRSVASPGSSSRELHLLFRVRSCLSPARTPQCRAPSLGSRSHSRHKLEESTYRRVSQTHHCSAHSVSHALDGLLLFKPCGLISSHCHVRDSRFRGFPRYLADQAHHQAVPSCR
jgi:hypothetical protein